MFFFCNLYLSEEGWGQGKGVFGQGTGCAADHKVVHMLLYYKNLIGMNIKIINADSSEFPAKCPCAFVYIYLCKFYQWILISIKVGQSLTGNRNYFCLRQSWSNFRSKSVKVVFTLSKFPIKVRQSELGRTLTKLTLMI